MATLEQLKEITQLIKKIDELEAHIDKVKQAKQQNQSKVGTEWNGGFKVMFHEQRSGWNHVELIEDFCMVCNDDFLQVYIMRAELKLKSLREKFEQITITGTL